MRYLSLFILLFLISTRLIGQPKPPTKKNFLTKIQTSVELGYMVTSTNFSDKLANQTGSAGYFYGYIGGHAYYTLLKAGEQVSVGLQPGLQVGYNLTRRENRDWMVNAPLIAMVKFGTNASRFSNSKVGLAIGAGGDLLHQRVRSAGNGLNRLTNEWESADYNGWAVVPAVVGELTLGKRDVRITRTLVKHMFFTIRFSAHPFQGLTMGAASYKVNNVWYKGKETTTGKYALSVVYNF